MVTQRQKDAVRWCEKFHYKFEGDIDNWKDVSAFLKEHLNVCKMTYATMLQIQEELYNGYDGR